MDLKKRNFVVFLILCCILCSFSSVCFSLDELPVDVSSDNSMLLKTSASHHGLVLLDTITEEETVVATSRGAGYFASISPGNRYVCVKLIETAEDGSRTHTPMLFDITKRKLIRLSPAASVCGTPAVSTDGKIGFTVGSMLRIMDMDFNLIKTLDLGHHVNLISFSRDGLSIAYNDVNEQIAIVSLDGKSQVVTDGNGSYWGPQFSPAGDRLLVSSVDGKVVCINLATGEAPVVGKGGNPGWVDNDTIAFTKKISNGRTVLKTELCFVTPTGAEKGAVLINKGDAELVVSGKSVAIAKDGILIKGILSESTTGISLNVSSEMAERSYALATALVEETHPAALPSKASTVVISGVPTIHQVYDTPEWFNGHWACGATAAAMALAYYGSFNYWDCWCMYPSSHYSHYGRYICETYIYNGHTFDIVETDPAGEYATGGYGYITQNDWEDTRTHMAEYIAYHGPSSYVDWTPTFAKACTEIDNYNPHVLLNSLTASGHYITGIGYYTDQYTLIFNDPYGDKNTPGYPSYDGTEVSYDWPGYNYGNENLNTVWCYIYARWSIHATPTPTPTVTQVIVDNADPECTLSGGWTISTNVRGWYGSNYAVAPMNSGALATFNLNIPVMGNYDVYALWTAASDRSLMAPYTVYYHGGSDTKTFDQRYWGGRWQLLGNYPFQAGSYQVELSANTGETGSTKYVIADAVKAAMPLPVPTPTPGTDVIVDNDDGQPMYTETGVWTTSSSSGYNGGTYRYSFAGEDATATWTGNLAYYGDYNVYAMFRQSANRVTAAQFIIHASDGDHTVYVNQNGENTIVERYMGTFSFNAGANSITLNSQGSTPVSDAVISDAVRFILATTPTPTPTPTPTATPTCMPVVVRTWSFEPPPDGWSYRTAAAPSGIPGWSNATAFSDSHSIGLVAGTSATTDYYGGWDSYIDATTPAVPWSANKLWRAIFTLSTNKADTNTVPSIRIRLSLTGMKASAYVQVTPNTDWIPIAQRGSGTTDLVVYMLPPIEDANGLFAAFDLIDFDRTPGVDGSVYLEEVTVDTYDLTTCYTAPGWTEYYSAAGSGLSTWTHSSAGVSYLTNVNSYGYDSTAPAGLRQTTTAAQDRAFGAYTSPTDIAINGDKLYRATFYLVCENSQNVQSNRIRLHSDDYKYAAYMSMEPGIGAESALPPPTPPKPYYVYFRFPTDPTGIRANMLAAWDLYDFNPGASAGGWAKLTEFTMENREP